MVYTVDEYAGQYADRNLLDRSALEKTGFRLGRRLCTWYDMETLDCVAAAHMLLPGLEKDCPDLYDARTRNADAIRMACSNAAVSVARLLRGDCASPAQSDVRLMAEYVMYVRRVRLNWARMDAPEFGGLRDAVDEAAERAGLGAIGSVRNNVIKRLPSIEIDPDLHADVIRKAVSEVVKDMGDKKGPER